MGCFVASAANGPGASLESNAPLSGPVVAGASGEDRKPNVRSISSRGDEARRDGRPNGMNRAMLETMSRSSLLFVAWGAAFGCGSSSGPTDTPHLDGGTDADPSIQRGTRIRLDSGEIEGETD